MPDFSRLLARIFFLTSWFVLGLVLASIGYLLAYGFGKEALPERVFSVVSTFLFFGILGTCVFFGWTRNFGYARPPDPVRFRATRASELNIPPSAVRTIAGAANAVSGLSAMLDAVVGAFLGLGRALLGKSAAALPRPPKVSPRKVVSSIMPSNWPYSLVWFVITLAFVVLLVTPLGILLVFLMLPFWSIFTVNFGFASMLVEAAIRPAVRKWAILPILWFGGYAVLTWVGHAEIGRFDARLEAENAKVQIPFDPARQALVVNGGYGVAATDFLRTFRLPVVYLPSASKPTEYEAYRYGEPALCEQIDRDPRLKSAGARTGHDGAPGGACVYVIHETPTLPVVRIETSETKVASWFLKGQSHTATIVANGRTSKLHAAYAAAYSWFPMPYIDFQFRGGDIWFSLWSENFRQLGYGAATDDLDLVGRALGLQRRSQGETLFVSGAAERLVREARKERAAVIDNAAQRTLAGAANAVDWRNYDEIEADRSVLAPYADRLAAATPAAIAKRAENAGALQNLVAHLPEADLMRIGPKLIADISEIFAREDRKDTTKIFLAGQLAERLGDLGPSALPLLDRQLTEWQGEGGGGAVVGMCRMGPAAAPVLAPYIERLVTRGRPIEMRDNERKAFAVAALRIGRPDLADRLDVALRAAADHDNHPGASRDWAEKFPKLRSEITPASDRQRCNVL